MSYTDVYHANRMAYKELILGAPERVALINDGIIRGIIVKNNAQTAGSMSESQFTRNKVHNETVFFDKGVNNLWMEHVSDKSQLIEDARRVGENPSEKDVNELTQSTFELYLDAVMKDRYYVRESNMGNLMKVLNYRYGEVVNMNFLDDFYMNLFKGTAFKTFFDDEIFSGEDRDDVIDDLRKRYNIFIKFEKSKGRIPNKRYYTFVDNPNPCHLINIMKDEFGRDEDNEGGDKVKYAFVNTKKIGKGKAGTVSLFSYYPDANPNKLQIAVKLMKKFDLTNNAKYLPLRITYFSHRTNTAIARTDRNIRYIYPMTEIGTINENYPKYSDHNLYSTNHHAYPSVALSCASDNFSNQTIQHMALQAILDPYEIDNYIKQYDAMLCWNSKQEELKEGADTMLDYIKRGIWSTANLALQTIDWAEATVDGVNFMEIASGDLHEFLFDIQKQYFSTVREVNDLELRCTTSFASDWDITITADTNYAALRHLFGEITSQLFTALSMLQHPKYAFVHGDLKTKNVFVKQVDPTEDPKGRKYIFKLADYDKSSITFNGIRFYNEGMGIVKMLNEHWGVSQYDITSAGEGTDIKIVVAEGDQIFFKESIDDDTYIEHLFAGVNDDKDRIQIMYDLIIKYIKSPETRAKKLIAESIAESIAELAAESAAEPAAELAAEPAAEPATVSSAASAVGIAAAPERSYSPEPMHSAQYDVPDDMIVGGLLNAIMNIIRKYGDKLSATILLKRIHSNLKNIVESHDNLDIKSAYEAIQIDVLSDRAMLITKCIEILVEINKTGYIDIYYNLNSLLTRLSVTITSLQDVEIEQLHVRYSPIPFHHTIDLYTLFLSMMQSPMVLTYLKYCQYADTMVDDKSFLDEDLFWQSFKGLWASTEDIDTILGYYDYLYKNPTTDDQASIGFILDPIKKNPISLIKRVDDSYWLRAWKWQGREYTWNSFIEENAADEIKKIRLSSGSFLRMPNICLTDKCDSFKMKIHRGTTVFYLNKDMIVYNASGVGEKISAMTVNKQTHKEAIRRMANSLRYSMSDLLSRNQGDLETLSKLLGITIDINIDVSSAKLKFDNHRLTWELSRWGRKNIYINNLNGAAADLLVWALQSDEIVTRNVSFLKKNEIMARMPWLVDYIKEKAIGEYEIPEHKQKIIDTMIDNIASYYDMILTDSSSGSKKFFAYIEYINKKIDEDDEERSPINKYAKHLHEEESAGIGDITGICKTNIYLDSFGNPTNWDYCYKMDREIGDQIIDAIEKGYLEEFRP